LCGLVELQQPGLYRRSTPQTLDERSLAELGQAEDAWVGQHLTAGNLSLLMDHASLAPGTKLDPYQVISYQLTEIDRAMRGGFAGVVIILDMTWLSENRATNQQLLKHEAAADAVFSYQSRPLIGLTQYDRQKTDAALVAELLKLHRLSIMGRYARLNPQHLDAERYVAHIIKATKPEKGQQPGRPVTHTPLQPPKERAATVSTPPHVAARGRSLSAPLAAEEPPLAAPRLGRQQRHLAPQSGREASPRRPLEGQD
jgi:hypothetical protein